ncbi:MAG: SAM-dependent methyltransferase [Verrucomicrobiae bacterium]|nr:SAM-dependent methyltransferase [Verrucomicrobiae bacterium]
MTEFRQHPESLKLLQTMREAAGKSRTLNYAEFIRHALYDSAHGYYHRDIQRVGRSRETDFYTSQSLGPLFGELVTSAVETLLNNFHGKELDLKTWTLVELGYESDSGWWSNRPCPFKSHQQVGPTDELKLSGKCVVFSNELFDAQPFHRVVFMQKQWYELGVDVSQEIAREVILPELSPEVSAYKNRLPLDAREGYTIDLPLQTISLLRSIICQTWTGLFLALDYGKTWKSLAYEIPQGTGRAYTKHRQSSNLLDQPGRQDITCHICWDWLEEGLKEADFQEIRLESQEAFFVTKATSCIEQIITARPGEFDPQRQNLMHLIHPSTMGQKFQVLSAFRD